MSPRVKRPRAELPKAIVQRGLVGALPVQDWSFSALYHGRCGSLIGFRDTEETLRAKEKLQIQIAVTAKKNDTLELAGKIFNGCSEALYRGQLPEVILTCLSDGNRADFLNDIADYIEQLLGMGFWGNKPNQVGINPVSLHFPCFILLGHGIWFSQMMAALSGFLKDLSRPFPVLTPELQAAVLGRFMRGSIPSELEWQADGNAKGFHLPERLCVAGGSPFSQQCAQSALAGYGWVVAVESTTRNAAERLEFQDAAWRLSSRVIPTLATQKLLSATEAKKLEPLVQQAILKIGYHREAFNPAEMMPAVPKEILKNNAGNLGKTKASLVPAERKTLLGLSAYATALGLIGEKKIFDRLAASFPANQSAD